MTDLVSRQATAATPAVAAAEDGARAELRLHLDLAKQLAGSSLLPKAYANNPANVFLAVNLGAELGLQPATAIFGMHVIDNRPSPSADLQASLARRAGHKVRPIEQTTEKAIVEIVRVDDPDYPVRVEYTIDDARTQGLLEVKARRWVNNPSGKDYPEDWVFPEDLPHDATAAEMIAAGCPEGIANDRRVQISRRDNWFNAPRRMLAHRAMTEAVSLACPEVLAGIDFVGIAEQAGTRLEVDTIEVDEADPVDVLTTPAVTEPDEVDHDDGIADAEIVEDEPEAEPDTRTVQEISGDPADAVFNPPADEKPPATVMPQAADPEPQPAAEAEEEQKLPTPTEFKAHVMSTGWTTVGLLKALAAEGHANVSIDQIANDVNLYSIALDTLETEPTK